MKNIQSLAICLAAAAALASCQQKEEPNMNNPKEIKVPGKSFTVTLDDVRVGVCPDSVYHFLPDISTLDYGSGEITYGKGRMECPGYEYDFEYLPQRCQLTATPSNTIFLKSTAPVNASSSSPAVDVVRIDECCYKLIYRNDGTATIRLWNGEDSPIEWTCRIGAARSVPLSGLKLRLWTPDVPPLDEHRMVSDLYGRILKIWPEIERMIILYDGNGKEINVGTLPEPFRQTDPETINRIIHLYGLGGLLDGSNFTGYGADFVKMEFTVPPFKTEPFEFYAKEGYDYNAYTAAHKSIDPDFVFEYDSYSYSHEYCTWKGCWMELIPEPLNATADNVLHITADAYRCDDVRYAKQGTPYEYVSYYIHTYMSNVRWVKGFRWFEPHHVSPAGRPQRTAEDCYHMDDPRFPFELIGRRIWIQNDESAFSFHNERDDRDYTFGIKNYQWYNGTEYEITKQFRQH